MVLDAGIRKYKEAATFIVAASDSLHKERADYVCDGAEHELIIDDCEVTWNSRQGANVVCTADADCQVGTFSAKMAVQAGAALGLLATYDFTALDLSNHTIIRLWIKHSLGCAAGDLVLHLSATADCGGAPDEEEIDVPTLAAGVWTQIGIPLANPGSDTAIISVGIYMEANDPGALNLFVDDVKQVWGDEIEIQAAIDALPNTGGKVLLLDGTYNVHSVNLHGSSNNKNNVEFVGSGWSTILKLPSMTRKNILETDGIEGLRIGNLQLDGNYSNQNMADWSMRERATNGCTAGVCEIYMNNIYIKNSSRVTVDAVYSHSSVHPAIMFHTDTTKSMVKGCYVKDVQWNGIEFWEGGTLSSIVGCYSENNYRAGIIVELNGEAKVSVIGNILSDDGTNTENGIRTQSNSYVTIVGNTLYKQRISVSGSDHNIISGNIINVGGRNTHGMRVIGNYNQIIGNSIYQPHEDGIRIENDYNIISGNMILNGNSRGIYLSSAATYNNILNNTIKDFAANPAVDEASGGDYNEVRGNFIINCTGGTIVLTGSHSLASVFYQYSDIFTDVLAASANYIVNAQNLINGAVVLTGTQPKYPRGLDCTITEVGGNVTDYTMTVVGTDAKGNTVTDVFTFADDGLAFSSDIAFDHITSVTLADVADTGNATFVMGIDKRLGWGNIIYETGDIWKITKNGTKQTVAIAQVDVNYDTYDMAVIGLAATDDFTIWYKSNLNIII